jgi:DNA repair protein RadC
MGLKKKKLKDLSESDRPREKLQAKGPEALSDLELLAILLGSGTKDSDVLTVAGRILKTIDGGNDKVSLDALQEIEGVGPAKAALIDNLKVNHGMAVEIRVSGKTSRKRNPYGPGMGHGAAAGPLP